MTRPTIETIRKMQEGRRRSLRNAKNAITSGKQGLLTPETHSEAIPPVPKGVRNVPERYKARYLRALSGKSMRAGVSSFCAECVGWEGLPDSVRECTAPGCPLFRYRPYRKSRLQASSDTE